MTQKDFSIIIAYYNNETILESLIWLLNSLKQIKKVKYEIFVVDDSSTYPFSDSILEFFKRSNIKYFKKEKNAGISEVRNTAIDLSTGKNLVFLDADCFVEKNYFKELTKNLKDLPNAGMIFGKREPYQQKPFERFREIKYRYKSGKYQEKEIKEFTKNSKDFYLVSGQNMVIKRNVLEKIGYFIPNTGCEDIEMQHLIMKVGYSSVYNPNLITYHKHPHKYLHYLRKAYRYGKGFEKFKNRQKIKLIKNKYYKVYMGEGKIFEKFESISGKTFKEKMEVWFMEIGDHFANKFARFMQRKFHKEPLLMLGAYGAIYKIKNKKLEFLVAKYEDGYGLIGGRLDKKEHIREAFVRELKEEVGITKDQLQSLFLTDKINSFTSKRAGGMEKHHFLITKVGDVKPIKGDVDFEWLSEKQMAKFTEWENTQKIINELIEIIKKNETL